MSVAATIEAKLTQALQPVSITIKDESHLHKGHGGYRSEGESHFRVEVVSTAFEGQTRVARQRRVYEILADELRGGVHALSVMALTPAESHGRRVPLFLK
jgi:BolA protein